jgi:disulfide oxidoreductase YuzD
MQYTDLNKHFRSQFNTKKIIEEFNKPIFKNKFFINKKLLYEDPQLINFNNTRWVRQPLIFCDDIYSEPYLYPIILLVNNVGSIIDFVPEKIYRRIIIAPKMQNIQSILSMEY